MTAEPLSTSLIWLVDTGHLAGCEFIVTSVDPKGAGERTVGSYRWHPTPAEKDALKPDDRLRLKSTPQAKRRGVLFGVETSLVADQ